MTTGKIIVIQKTRLTVLSKAKGLETKGLEKVKPFTHPTKVSISVEDTVASGAERSLAVS